MLKRLWILSAALVWAASAAALPVDFDWSGRDLLFRLAESELEGTRPPRANSAGRPVAVMRSPGLVSLRTDLTPEMARQTYALRVRGTPATEYVLAVNGKELEIEPVEGPDGFYFLIPDITLREAENAFSFQATGKTDLVFQEVEAFALKFTDEDVHFAQTFGLRPRTLVQPPTHSEQLKYDALHYNLAITLDMSSAYINASLTATVESLDSTLAQIVLDLNDNGGNMAVTAVDQGPSTPALPFTLSGSENRLYITLPAAVPAGSAATVRVFYQGTPASRTLFGNPYRRTTHSGTPIVYTFSEPYGARYWWPCKDVPDDKATMELHITCPTAHTAVSNGTLLSLVDNGNGTHTYNWFEAYPMVTYLASIACTNYVKYTGTYTSLLGTATMEVSNYIFPENVGTESNGVGGTLALMEFFARTFGEYAFLTEKYVTATHTISSSMEHQTATSLRPGGVSSDGLTRSNCHELAHQWFGDAITMRHFDHLWLNEGFGTYLEALWEEDQFGTTAYHNYVNAWTTSDAYPIISSSADSFSGSIVYRKGAWVLHMLRHVVGDTDFFQAIRNYYADPSLLYGAALTPDLVAHFNAVTGEDLSWFFDEWLYRAARPNYQWYWRTHLEGGDTMLDLHLAQMQGGDPYIMPIDFGVEISGGPAQTVTIQSNLTTQDFEINLGPGISVLSVTFDPDNWVLDYSTEVPPPAVSSWTIY